MLTAVNPAPEHIGSSVSVSLRVRDLSARDLSACTWSGSATHLRHVEEELVRAAAGEVDYLAVCTAADLPVAIGGVDYRVADGAGTLWQLAVLPALQGHGLGTLLIRAAEQRIRDAACTGRNSPWRRTTPGPVPCTSAWVTSSTVAHLTPGTPRGPTE